MASVKRRTSSPFLDSKCKAKRSAVRRPTPGKPAIWSTARSMRRDGISTGAKLRGDVACRHGHPHPGPSRGGRLSRTSLVARPPHRRPGQHVRLLPGWPSEPLVGRGLWHDWDLPQRRDLPLGPRMGGHPTVRLHANGAGLCGGLCCHHHRPAPAVLSTSTDQHLRVPRTAHRNAIVQDWGRLFLAVPKHGCGVQAVPRGAGAERNGPARGVRRHGMVKADRSHRGCARRDLGLYPARRHRHRGVDRHLANRVHAPGRNRGSGADWTGAGRVHPGFAGSRGPIRPCEVVVPRRLGRGQSRGQTVHRRRVHLAVHDGVGPGHDAEELEL